MSIFKELGIREGKDRVNEEVVYNIARTYNIIDRAITGKLSEFNLSSAKFNILLMIKHIGKDTGLAQNEISKLLLVTTSNVTRMVDKLENDGYVERFPEEGDRRVNRVKITGKGSELLEKAWKPYKRAVDSLINKVYKNSEKNKIVDLLGRLK